MSWLLFIGLIALASYVLYALNEILEILKIIVESIAAHLEFHRKASR